jgi:hypothetical protein
VFSKQPSGDHPQFESHLLHLNEQVRTLMVDLRKFVLSLGNNVIEEVRPHRVVYSKSMNFRIFLDIEPASDSLILLVRSGRATSSMISTTIKTAHEAENIKVQIAEAYTKIK